MELVIVKTIRFICDKIYVETKELTREELLERDNKRGREVLKKFSRSSHGTKLSE